MHPELTPLKQPIAIRLDYIADKNTSFRVQQHGKALSSGKFTIFSPDGHATLKNGAEASPSKKPSLQPMMHVNGKYMEPTDRRVFTDATGLPLFDVYHGKLDKTWLIELPGGRSLPVARIQPHLGLKDNLDVDVKNVADNGDEVLLWFYSAC